MQTKMVNWTHMNIRIQNRNINQIYLISFLPNKYNIISQRQTFCGILVMEKKTRMQSRSDKIIAVQKKMINELMQMLANGYIHTHAHTKGKTDLIAHTIPSFMQ